MEKGYTMPKGFALGKFIGQKYRVNSEILYAKVYDMTGMDKFWQKCKGLTPENERGFRMGFCMGAGYPLPEQDWSGYDG